MDEFIAQHTVTIRGINEEMSCEDADFKIKQIFEERYGPK
jgi:hypothetical protein